MDEPSPHAHPAYRIDDQEVGMAGSTPANSIDRRGLLLPLVSVSQLEARALIAMKPNAAGPLRFRRVSFASFFQTTLSGSSSFFQLVAGKLIVRPGELILLASQGAQRAAT